MSGPQRGQNLGVSGLASFPGLGDSGTKFYFKTIAWEDKIGSEGKVRAGRSSSDLFERTRPMMVGGQITLSFLVNTLAFPAPDAWKGEEGTIELTYAEGKTRTLQVRAKAMSQRLNNSTDTDIKGALTCDIIGDPDYDGFGGTQPESTTPEGDDEEQWRGTQKVYDEKGLLTSAIRRIDVWGDLANTDQAEIQRLTDTVAANSTPPLPYLKVKTAMFVRDSLDGGEIILSYSLTDSEEDVYNPIEHTTDDEFGLARSAARALYGEEPGPVSGFIPRSLTIRESNDQKILYVRTYGNRSLKGDVEIPGTFKKRDVNDLGSTAQITLHNQSPNPPNAPDSPIPGLLVSVLRQQLDESPGNWKHVFEYGNVDSDDRIVFAVSQTSDDPQNLQDFDVQAAVVFTAADQTTPSPRIEGLKLRSAVKRRIQTTPEAWLWVWTFGVRNTEQDITFPGTPTTQDVSHLADSAKITLVTEDSTQPSTPPAPVGQNIGYEVVQIHAVDTEEKWQHVFHYGNTTNQQKIEFKAIHNVDPTILEDTKTYVEVTTSEAFPNAPDYSASGVKLRGKSRQRIAGTPEKWEHTFIYGKRTTKEDREWLQSKAHFEPSEVKRQEIVVRVTSSDVLDLTGLNPDPTNLSLLWYHTHRETDDQWVHVATYAALTVSEQMEADATVNVDDPQTFLLSGTTRGVLSANTSESPPGVAGMECVARKSQRAAKGKWFHTFTYDFRTLAGKEVADRTKFLVDANSLDDEAITALVYTVGQEPSIPTVADFPDIDQTLLLEDSTTTELPNPDYRVRVYHWVRTTKLQKMVLEGTVAVAHSIENFETKIATIHAHTGTAKALVDALRETNDTNKDWVQAQVKKLSASQAISIVEEIGDDRLFHSARGNVVRDSLNCWNGGWGNENATLLVQVEGAIVGGPGGFLTGKVLPRVVDRCTGSFAYRRRHVVAAANFDQHLHLHLDAQGKVNHEEWKNRQAHTVMYAGPAEQHNYSIGSTHRLILIDYLFDYDSEMFVNDSLIPRYRVWVRNIFQPLVVTGFYAHTRFTESQFGVTWPTEWQFNIFDS